MNTNEIIEIKQLPIIEERLQKLRTEIEAETNNALAMVCTEETVKEVKKVRAELNKQFAELETRRKNVKKQLETPYNEFNSVYEECVGKVYKAADTALKKKIGEVENGLKSQKREKILSYAAELKAAYTLDWLDVERILPNVTLSASISSLQTTVATAIEKINMECECITGMDNADESAEIFAEYQKTLNLAQAKLTVSQRRKEVERTKAEAQKKAEQEQIKRETEQKIEMLAPPVVKEELSEPHIEEVKKYQMTFTVRAAKEKLRALKAFIVENNIEIIGGK